MDTRKNRLRVNGVDVTEFVKSGGASTTAAAPETDAFKGNRELVVSEPIDSLVINTVHDSTVTVVVKEGGSIGGLTAEDGTIVIKGSVQRGVKTTAGNVSVKGSVEGDVATMSGDVKIAGDIGGSAKTTTGDIKARSVAGERETMSGRVKGGKAGAKKAKKRRRM